MTDLTISHNDGQDPEALNRKAELISRTVSHTLEQQTGLLDTLFPGKITVLKQRQMEKLAEEHLADMIEISRASRQNQLVLLKTFFLENQTRVTRELAVDTDVTTNPLYAITMKSFSDTEAEIIGILTERLDQVSKIPHEKLREKAEASLLESIDLMIDTLKNTMKNFLAKWEGSNKTKTK